MREIAPEGEELLSSGRRGKRTCPHGDCLLLGLITSVWNSQASYISDGEVCGPGVDDVTLGPSPATCWLYDCGLWSSLGLDSLLQMWVLETPSFTELLYDTQCLVNHHVKSRFVITPDSIFSSPQIPYKLLLSAASYFLLPEFGLARG